MNYRKISVLIALGIICIINAQGQVSDRVRITLTPPLGTQEHIRIDTNEASTEYFDVGKDAVTKYSPYFFTTLAREWEYAEGIIVPEEGEEEQPVHLVIDERPYKDKYFVDYPLYLETSSLGTYTISLTVGSMKKSVFIRLIDKENPDLFINLNERDFSFSKEKAGKVVYDDRFTVRIYAATLFKEDATNHDWFDINNWIGTTKIPGTEIGVDNRHNYCIVIPENAIVEVPSGNLAIGTLLNSGVMNVSEETTLTIENGAQLTSTKEFY